jgi:hypothetical protein
MAGNTINRRRMLRGAGMAVGGAAITSVGLGSPALATSKASKASKASKNGVAGSWMIVHQDELDPTPVRAVLSFADGGVFISHDISPAGPPFTGSWERRGDHRFRATFWSGFPGDQGPGSAGPTARITATGRVARDTMSGTFTFTLFAPTGEELESADGTFTGTRIEA